MKINVLMTTAALLFSGVSLAQDEGSLKVTSEVFKVVITKDDDGKETEKLLKPEDTKMLPKDELVYINTIENVSAEPADNIEITNPIDENITYKTGSATGVGAEITFSVNGGKTYADESILKVTDVNGLKHKAKPEDYTDIKWRMVKSLNPGERAIVTFKATINGNP